LLGSGIFFCRDTAGLSYVLWSYLKQRLAEHSWPLWFPYDGLGAPFIGSTVSITFHPVALLLMVTSVAQVWRLAALGSFALAFLATWKLAEQFECSRGGAALAAVSFVYCGALVSQVSNSVYLMGGALWPLFCLGIAKSAQGRAVFGAGVSAAAFALCCGAGDFQSALLMGAMSLPIYFAAQPHLARPARAVLVVTLTGVWGLALSAAQLFPTIDTFLQIDRSSGLSWSEVSRWSLHPARLPELFLGDLVHWVPGADVPNLIRQEILGSEGLWSTTVCLGVLALLCIPFALLLPARSHRPELILLSMALVLLWLSLGPFGGLYAIPFRLVPLWSAFRFPEKLVLHASLPIALLAGRGLSLAERSLERKQTRKLLAIVLALLVLSIAVAGILAFAPLSAPWHAYWTQFASQGGMALAIALPAAFLIWRHSGLTSICVPLLAFLHLAAINRRTSDLCTAPSWTAELGSEAADAIRRAESGPVLGHARVTAAFSRPGRLVSKDFEEELGSQAATALWEHKVLYPDHSAVFGIETIGRILPVRPKRYALWHQYANQSVWAALNTRYVVTAPEDEWRFAPIGATRVALLPELDALVLRLNGALPRVYLSQAWPAESEETGAARLTNAAVLSGARVVVDSGLQVPSAELAAGSAQVVSYRPERVEIQASVARAGVLVLNDSFFEGWKAWVDQKQVPIFPANLLVRGVWLDAGEHRIVFEYPMPLALRAGLAISSVTLLATLVFALISVAKRTGTRT
jgi:hypothetical protein